MDNLNTIFLFVFIFSVLTVLRTVARILSSLFSNPPKKIEWYRGELVYLGLAITYCLTYFIKN
jgi:hypothetical protein